MLKKCTGVCIVLHFGDAPKVGKTMNHIPVITKTEFVRGSNCVRRPWLDLHRPELKPQLSTVAKDTMETGKLLGALARKRYENGTMVYRPGLESKDAVSETMQAIAQGLPCLFEATFVASGRLARLDIIHRDESGEWTIDEVKSASVKEPKELDQDILLDIAFQFHTTKAAGQPVKNARLVLVDTSFVWDGSDFDPHSLLGTVDVTEFCESIGAQIADNSNRLAEVLGSDAEPEVELNTHCKGCDYFNHCHANSPKNDLIFLPKILPNAVNALRAKGYRSITDIPESETLTETRKRMRDVLVSHKPYIGDGLKEELDSIPFPAAFIDFESSNPTFPMYRGTRPYQQVCFQWSAHILETPDASTVHDENLADGSADPRPAFCQSLWEFIKDCKSIVHYSGFEKTQLKAMVADGIPLAQELLDMIQEHSVDLENIVSKYVYLEGFQGRTSIKVVLPTLVPSMSYKDMLISDGMGAAIGFRKMIAASTPPKDAAELREALLTYCCQDTLAMVEIYRALYALASPKSD